MLTKVLALVLLLSLLLNCGCDFLAICVYYFCMVKSYKTIINSMFIVLNPCPAEPRYTLPLQTV